MVRRSSIPAGELGKISFDLFTHDGKERLDAIGSKSGLGRSLAEKAHGPAGELKQCSAMVAELPATWALK